MTLTLTIGAAEALPLWLAVPLVLRLALTAAALAFLAMLLLAMAFAAMLLMALIGAMARSIGTLTMRTLLLMLLRTAVLRLSGGGRRQLGVAPAVG